MKMNHVLLQVSDMERSKRFYEDAMGMKIRHDFGSHVSFTGGLAIHEKEDYQRLISSRVPTDHKAILYFESEDLEADEQSLRNAGVKIVNEITEQPWNQRVFRCLDPDDNLIEVGESVKQLVVRLHSEGMDRQQILEATSFDLDTVDHALEESYGDRQSRMS